MSFSQRLHKVIPAGCHTYSRGDDQFPSNAPQILTGGHGAYVYDGKRKLLDYGMGLRSVAIGYAEPEINKAAIEQIENGNCLTRPSMIELEAAELACSVLGFDMVKFTKNGSTATTAAIKLARAARGVDTVLCADQPFFSYDDWFISTTSRAEGSIDSNLTTRFDSIESLEMSISARRGDVACVILEPKDYDLKAIRALCDRHGIILIFDEMITGFRYHWPSMQKAVGVKPDLSCFGKAMANGFSVACLGGKREIMELGANRDMFLASTTHGAEMSGLGAFAATVKFMQRHDVARHLRQYREELDKIIPPIFTESPERKTLFMQEMVKNGVLMPWIAHSYRHGEEELKITKAAIERSMQAIENGAELVGKPVRPVFG